MNQFKRAQVVMLPTDKPSRLYLDANKEFQTRVATISNRNVINQNIHITSDEEIKEGDWVLYKNNPCLVSLNAYSGEMKVTLTYATKYCKKIIATTDTSLRIKAENGVLGLMLPQPSQQFIEKYIESYNKGNLIEWVNIEYEEQSNCTNYITESCVKVCLSCSNLKLKVNPKDNTITIKKLKDNWNREEVASLIRSYYKDIPNNMYDFGDEETEYWINENL